MLQGRVLCRISFVIILIIAISSYAPWDFLGVYDKVEAVEEHLVEDSFANAEGLVYHKEIKKDKVLYYVKNASITTGSKKLSNISFLFKIDSDEIPNNSKLNIKGRIKHFSVATNDGCFDMKDYYNSLGLYFELQDISFYDYQSNYFSSIDFGFLVRRQISKVYEEALPGEEAGFLSGVIVGEKSGLDGELKSLFQDVGIAHILAVSGLHVSIICMSLYRLLRKGGLSFLWCSFWAGIVAILYGIITGGSVSSIRAIGMFLVYLLAQVVGEKYDMLTALALMADILLFDNPLYIKNGSFIFSFSAVIGIYFIVLPLNTAYTNHCKNIKKANKSHEHFIEEKVPLGRRFVQYIIRSLIFSLGMYAAMLPIVTQLYHQTPLYSLLLNIIVLPLMPVVIGVGLVAGVMGLFFMPIAEVLLYICHIVIYFYELLSSFVNKLPLAEIIVGHKSVWIVAAYYVMLVFVIHGMDYLVKWKRGLGEKRCKSLGKTSSGLYGGPLGKASGGMFGRPFGKASGGMFGRPLGKVILLLIMCLFWLAPTRGQFEIDILDVGQGDGIYINSGDGVRFFIDGGSTSTDKIGQYTLLPFLKYMGANRIDYWFISHTDEDHISGLLELLEEGYDIENIVLSSQIPKGDALAEIISLGKKNDTNILYMNQGDLCGTRHLRFKCVYPGDNDSSDDINALSLSLLMEYDNNLDGIVDYSAFFGGDIGSEQEKLIASSGLVEHVNLLKVSHHGSRYSSDADFLSVLSPDVAVISCSKRNRYGHPADEAIQRLENSGARIYYTMNSGRVKVLDGDIKLFIKKTK